jgi:Mg-chelatase subunit ChlD
VRRGREEDPEHERVRGPAERRETAAEEEDYSHEWEYEFMGVTDRGTHVCFVLDASASMSFAQAKGGKVKRDRMKQHLIDAIEDLESEVSFTVVFFTAEAYAMTGKFVKATVANKNEAVAWVNGFERRGATNLWSGLQRAFEIVRKVPESEQKGGKEPFHVTMYVLSDGRVRDAQQILSAAATAVRSAPVTIHTISFDAEDEVLAQLAKVGKGEYQVAR